MIRNLEEKVDLLNQKANAILSCVALLVGLAIGNCVGSWITAFL